MAGRAQILVLAMALALSGCDRPSEAQQLTAIDAHTAKSGSDLALRQTADLTARVNELERQMESLKAVVAENVAAHESLRKTFNSNVQKDNNEAVRDMTRRGVCGTERVNYQDGGWAFRNRECTLKDLK